MLRSLVGSEMCIRDSLTAPRGNIEKRPSEGQMRAMPAFPGAKSKPVCPTGSEKMGPLFGPLCKLVKKLKICPSPTFGSRVVKFVRPIGDHNAPKQKNFGGPPLKFGGDRGGQTFFFPPSPLKNPSSDFGNFVIYCSPRCPVHRVKISSKSDDQFFR